MHSYLLKNDNIIIAAIAQSSEYKVRKFFARGASLFYLVWWPLWFQALVPLWKPYVVVAYGVVRGLQALGYTYYGWFSNDLGVPRIKK